MVGWNQVNRLALMVLNEKDLAKNMEKRIRKAMQSYGYRSDGFREQRIIGKSAGGFAYEYTVQGTEMYAESYTMKLDKTVYYFHFYSRTALKDENIPVWRGILDGAVLKG